MNCLSEELFLFRHRDFSGIQFRNTQQTKSLLSPSLSLLYLFFSLSTRHTQSTYQFPIWHPPLALRLVISLYPTEKKRNATERGGVAVSSAEHKVPFVFRFRDLPRTSIAVGAAVRAFLHPRPTG